MNIIDNPSPNYWWDNTPIKAIVLHGTAGSLLSAIGWLCNRKSGVSSNYLIGKNGKVFCLVNPYQGKRAWANGIVETSDRSIKWLNDAIANRINPNVETISIEHEANSWDMENNGRMTDAQWRASQDLVTQLLQDFGLPMTDQTVIGHFQISGKNKKYCPGVIFVPAYREQLALLKS